MAPYLLLLVLPLTAAAAPKSVLVFGDSWGELGPSYHEIQDTLERHWVPARVRSSAVSGTTACHWAEQNDGMAMVDEARKMFPLLADGPDFVWYTLGGNDLIFSDEVKACAHGARSFDAMLGCVRKAVDGIRECTVKLLDTYWKFFPKSRVMHSGYDLPCESALCDLTITGMYDAGWCGFNHTCVNELQVEFHKMYIGGLAARYKFWRPQYTGINIHGAVQKAAGVPGADVGKPVLSQGGPCKWEEFCVHPKYGTPAATAVGEAFWDLYFSKHLGFAQTGANSTLLV